MRFISTGLSLTITLQKGLLGSRPIFVVEDPLTMKEKPLIIFGSGGHAKVLLDLIFVSKRFSVVAVVAPEVPQDDIYASMKLLPSDDDVLAFSPDSIFLVNGIGSTGISLKRRQIFLQFKDRGYFFKTLRHESAIVSNYCTIGEGAQLMAGCIIQAGSFIGSNCIINTHASVDHDCCIGDHVHVAPGVTLSGGVTIGSGSHVGTGATIIQGVTLGKNVMVAAGAVVTKNIGDDIVVKGVPAR